MKILCLYNNMCAEELFDWLEEVGHDVVRCSEKLDEDWCRQQKFELTVSYTYRYILGEELLEALGNNAVNIHNSYLPWNRGADPNMWSIIDGSPRGVSLHYMDVGLDKGSVIAQTIVDDLQENSTLQSTYDNLDKEGKDLFKKAFRYYDYWKDMSKTVSGKGSYHSVADGAIIRQRISTYNISVNEVRNIYYNECND